MKGGMGYRQTYNDAPAKGVVVQRVAAEHMFTDYVQMLMRATQHYQMIERLMPKMAT